MFFWRSQAGLEIDLIVQARGAYWPVEIKLTSTPRAKHADALTGFKGLAGGDASDQGFLCAR
jgi:Holliday junction resolvase-like predicted endonuclease